MTATLNGTANVGAGSSQRTGRINRAKKNSSSPAGGPGGAARGAKPSPRVLKADRLAIAVAAGGAGLTVVFSMVLNVWGFTHSSDLSPGWRWFGTCLGIVLPLWVISLTFIGQHMHGKDNLVSALCYLFAVFALIVSLPHLANGFAQLGLSWWEGWSLAVVTDMTQVAMKMAIIRMVGR